MYKCLCKSCTMQESSKVKAAARLALPTFVNCWFWRLCEQLREVGSACVAAWLRIHHRHLHAHTHTYTHAIFVWMATVKCSYAHAKRTCHCPLDKRMQQVMLRIRHVRLHPVVQKQSLSFIIWLHRNSNFFTFLSLFFSFAYLFCASQITNTLEVCKCV